MTLVDVIEALFPDLKSKVKLGESFPCPLAMHQPNDKRPIFIRDMNGEQYWRCDAGCAGDKWKHEIQFIEQAIGLDALSAFELWEDLLPMANHEQRKGFIKFTYPKWYPEGVLA